jgi:CheY-like chemotaxis protein
MFVITIDIKTGKSTLTYREPCMFRIEHRCQCPYQSHEGAMANILLAEGNVQMRLLSKQLIETKEGWKVTEAVDGYDAITKVAQLKPDLVVLDFAMPGLNGLQTAEKITSAFPNLPVILYTFYGFNAMVAEAKKHGIREVIDKTESGDRLLEAIQKHLPATQQPLSLPATESLQDVGGKEEPPKVN